MGERFFSCLLSSLLRMSFRVEVVIVSSSLCIVLILTKNWLTFDLSCEFSADLRERLRLDAEV